MKWEQGEARCRRLARAAAADTVAGGVGFFPRIDENHCLSLHWIIGIRFVSDWSHGRLDGG
jgi:hypothetical protein